MNNKNTSHAIYMREYRKRKKEENPEYWKEIYKKYKSSYIKCGSNKENIRDINKRYRNKNEESIRLKTRLLRKKETYKEKQRINQKRYKQKYPEKIKAHKLANKNKPVPKINCVECRKNGKLEYHHPDYSKPLYVVVLCKSCHTKKTYGDDLYV